MTGRVLSCAARTPGVSYVQNIYVIYIYVQSIYLAKTDPFFFHSFFFFSHRFGLLRGASLKNSWRRPGQIGQSSNPHPAC